MVDFVAADAELDLLEFPRRLRPVVDEVVVDLVEVRGRPLPLQEQAVHRVAVAGGDAGQIHDVRRGRAWPRTDG